jgi:hypothetical protein
MSTRKRIAFYVDETMKTEQGYIPSVVTEGEPGHSPLVGNGEFASPWYWGKDIETAKRLAADANAKLGLGPQEVLEIILSSTSASRSEAPGVTVDDLDEGREYRVMCFPEEGEPFDFVDPYRGRDGDTLIFKRHRINLAVMDRVEITGVGLIS